jgi:hypothetical protein
MFPVPERRADRRCSGNRRSTAPRQDRDNAAMFTVSGVPAHPLLVHAVVVLIPLAALGAVAVAVRPVWARPYGLLVAAGALGGAVSAVLARIAGEQLEDAIEITPSFEPVIDQHERFGTLVVITAWPFALLAIAAFVLARRGSGASRHGTARHADHDRDVLTRPGRATRVVAALAALAGLVATGATVLAGHSGGAAVWSSVVGG